MRYAFLIYRDEGTALTEHERRHRAEQLTAILDRLGERRVAADIQ
jgi:hypothetical protein